MAIEKENLLSQLNTHLQTREDLLLSVKKDMSWKSAQITKLEAGINELEQKAEALETNKEKFKKDLIWARNYCLEMNGKVKEMESRATAAANRIQGNFYPVMNRGGGQFNYVQAAVMNYEQPKITVSMPRQNYLGSPRQRRISFNPSGSEKGFRVQQSFNKNPKYPSLRNRLDSFVIQNIQSVSESDFNSSASRTRTPPREINSEELRVGDDVSSNQNK